jgi:rhamnulokinase
MTVRGTVAAVDLGATSGRVMLGIVGRDELRLLPVSRFPNGPIAQADGLHWDVSELYRNVTLGLAAALRSEPSIVSVGVDAWAVDYARLAGGRMLQEPFHYRDDRNLAAAEAVHDRVTPSDLYLANGLQYLPFNTLYQLTADRLSGALGATERILLIPDLINFWLSGQEFAERTNASTTGLLGVGTDSWNGALLGALDLPVSLLPPLVDAGTALGPVTDSAVGVPISVTAVGSHDTASAVVAIPSTGDDFAYISCGTWGLVGVELERPVLSEASRLANFTNEGGVDGRIRYLHNVMGLWLLSESVRTWEREGDPIDLTALLDAAAAVTAPVSIFDANDARFLAPGDIPARIGEWLGERGMPVPAGRAELVRSILESLAEAFARAVDDAVALSGKRVSVIHLVGGGSQNRLLCQLTADRSGLPVLAGPVEATAIGNVLVQARAAGLASGSLESLRALVAAAFPPRQYLPNA